jgi:chorismate synthase
MKSPLYMPDLDASAQAELLLEQKMKEQDSVGGVVECVVKGLSAGIGEPVFDKLDANLAKAVMSIGAVKGVEIGDGFGAADAFGSQNNDSFCVNREGKVEKATNHAGGILGGISDGSDIVLRAAIKPTPSISRQQRTVNRQGQEIEISVKGRHDPIIVPRAVVVVEAMTGLCVLDMMLAGMSSRMDYVKKIWR